jgi:hypothetical protein
MDQFTTEYYHLVLTKFNYDIYQLQKEFYRFQQIPLTYYDPDDFSTVKQINIEV